MAHTRASGAGLAPRHGKHRHALLEVDPDLPEARRRLALTYLRQEKLEEATAASLAAAGPRHFFPIANFHLGEAFMRMGMHTRAVDALEVVIS